MSGIAEGILPVHVGLGRPGGTVAHTARAWGSHMVADGRDQLEQSAEKTETKSKAENSVSETLDSGARKITAENEKSRIDQSVDDFIKNDMFKEFEGFHKFELLDSQDIR